ncbi:UNKNOWN [Stylonychia lemnae]|uniref:Uncharacterized protein n=1 Tax=Stylonychia lemnae TaxID=5949 RepID=A0A078A7R7_STYLE|nr:UNKNOWN [Stylonychia lemnae]|eukprot:CDW76831.1 UNKNOWN [Stylonychia lemnae]
MSVPNFSDMEPRVYSFEDTLMQPESSTHLDQTNWGLKQENLGVQAENVQQTLRWACHQEGTRGSLSLRSSSITLIEPQYQHNDFILLPFNLDFDNPEEESVFKQQNYSLFKLSEQWDQYLLCDQDNLLNEGQLVKESSTDNMPLLHSLNHEITGVYDEMSDQEENSIQQINISQKGQKSMIFVKARRQLKGIKYQIGKIKRRDILVKATLRKIRKFFLAKFNQATNYIKEKKKKSEGFLIEKLEYFLKNFLIKNDEIYNISSQQLEQTYKQDLIIFMGSILYHNTMIRIYANDNEALEKINRIHQITYVYSTKLLEELLNEPSFRDIISLFNSIYRSQSDSLMDKLTRSDPKFEYGIDYLMCLMNEQEQMEE